MGRGLSTCQDGFQMQYHAEGQGLHAMQMSGCFVMRSDLQQLLVKSLPEGTVKLGLSVWSFRACFKRFLEAFRGTLRL